jgi:hypothetical protein
MFRCGTWARHRHGVVVLKFFWLLKAWMPRIPLYRVFLLYIVFDIFYILLVIPIVNPCAENDLFFPVRHCLVQVYRNWTSGFPTNRSPQLDVAVDQP